MVKQGRERDMEILERLKEEMPFKWRVGQTNKEKTKASVLAYIDARQASAKLNEICGLGWRKTYKMLGELLVCNVEIWSYELNQWISREDTGSESNMEAEKGLVSDAFKRACVAYGLGEFLYSMESKWFNFNGKQILDDAGKPVWDVTKFVNDSFNRESPEKIKGKVTEEKTKAKPKAEPKTEKPKEAKSVAPVENTIAQEIISVGAQLKELLSIPDIVNDEEKKKIIANAKAYKETKTEEELLEYYAKVVEKLNKRKQK